MEQGLMRHALCVVLKKVYKKSKLLWKLNAAGRCVSVSEVRGDAARRGGHGHALFLEALVINEL